MKYLNLNQMLDEVTAANLRQLKTGLASDWDSFQFKYWSLKAEIENLLRHSELSRPPDFKRIVSMINRIDSQVNQTKRRWNEEDALKWKKLNDRDRKRCLKNFKGVIWSGGRADGNSA